MPTNLKLFGAVNRKHAGYADLEVTATSPLGRHLPIEVKGTDDGEGELIEFVPSVAGKYKIAINFGGVEIPGSPVTFIAQDSNLPKLEGTGLKFGFLREKATFTVNARGLSGKLDVRVNGTDTEAEVTVTEDSGLFQVAYVPEEVGALDVRVLWSGRELPGSPFHPQVVDLKSVNPIGGWDGIVDDKGNVSLVLNEEKKISFDTLGAGQGKLRATIRGPDGETNEAGVEQSGPTKYKLSFTPVVEGKLQSFATVFDWC